MFSLGLGGIVLAGVVAWIAWAGGASPSPSLLAVLVAPAGSMIVAAFGLYAPAMQGKGHGTSAWLLRAAALTVLTPFVASLLAALVLALVMHPIFGLGIMVGFFTGGIAWPAFAATLGWSLLYVFVIHPRLSTQTAS